MRSVDHARELFLNAFRWTDGHADLSAVFRSPDLLAALGPAMVASFRSAGVTVVVGPEARGFVLGALCARALDVGLVLARKTGSIHPGPRVTTTSEPDWRGRQISFEISKVLGPTDRVLLVDDWIETGSQADAVRRAIELCGAVLVGTSVIVDQRSPSRCEALRLSSLVRYSELPPSNS